MLTLTKERIEALNKVTEILDNFLKPFDCTAIPGTEFQYFPAYNSIMYAFLIEEKFINSFSSFVNTNFADIKADPFLWAFLHELGHNETEDDFEDEEWEEYLYDSTHCKEISDYYTLPIEYAATAWAANYMRTNTTEVQILWKKLSPAIKNFYDTF